MDESKKCPFTPAVNNPAGLTREPVQKMKFYTSQQKLLEQYKERKLKLKEQTNE